MPSAFRSAALPTPESCSSCGLLIAPPHSTTWPALTRLAQPNRRYSTPTARLPSKTTRSTNALVITSRFGLSHHRMQVGAGGRKPAAVADVAVELRETLLPVTVYVIGARVTGLLGRGEERLEQRVGRRTALERKRTVVPAVGVVGRGGQAVLHPVEVRQAVRVVPVAHAGVRTPALVVHRIAALEDHPVDAAGAAEHLAAGVVDAAAVHVRLGFGLVFPVVETTSDGKRQRRGHVHEHVPQRIVAARFQNQNLVGLVGRQVGWRARILPIRRRRSRSRTAPIVHRCSSCGSWEKAIATKRDTHHVSLYATASRIVAL